MMWGAVPIRNVHGHLHEGVHNQLVYDLATIRILGPWQLLGGDNLTSN